MSETWKPVEGYESLYEVSDHGRVRSLDHDVECLSRWGTVVTRHWKGRMLAPLSDEQGRFNVALCREGVKSRRKIAQLVAIAFLPPVVGASLVDHKDGNNQNNHVSNLRWATAADNMRNKHKTSGLSGEVGVDKRPHCVSKPWRAQGTDRNGRPTHLGYFASKAEAVAVYRHFRAENF